MSHPIPWIDSALSELAELAHRHAERGLDPASAFRVLALSSRVDQARAAGREAVLPEPLRAVAAAVAAKARGPGRQGVLSRLDTHLTRRDDPFGQLLDVLLDIDDVVSVEEAMGSAPAATELARLAGAYVALHSTRVGALGGFADARLELLPAGAAIREVWELIARASGTAAVEALEPLSPAIISPSRVRLARRLQAARGARVEAEISETPVMAWLVAPAAAGQDARPEASEDADEVGVYLEAEQVLVNVELPAGKEAAGPVEVRVEAPGHSVTWTFPRVIASPQAVIVKLGTATELRGRLAREGISISEGGLRFFVSLALRERRDDTR
ncbi:hypothetical protein JYK02_05830 [Corallococcus macrosporus]|uniref:Uncharacterized protein n=1 Tax=Corallococcus macrosporus TaxID=35 RepID=A0ABS3D5T4_9BACT|nr:hypothetical protein [Corallococcus macrosporus]MBN8227028.1 hypothetical protein [Corallococcus macrosporus]